MEKLKRKTFIVIFSILTIFLISILCIFNYQDYKHEKTEINNNLNKINRRNENIEFNIEKNKEEDQNKNKQTEEKTITGETETLKEEYTTTDSDKSAILVENGGNATIEGATISKTGGDSTNTDAIINLKNCQLTYGSNTLISNKGTTEWGTTGTNGGNLTLNAENQTLKGNIETAKQIDIKIDSNTKIKLTGNSYITSLEDEDTTYSNIDFNEYTLYVNGTAIN